MAVVIYDTSFFAEEAEVARRSAEIVVPTVIIPGQAVIDVGCGTGAWLDVALEYGCVVWGVDGFAPESAIVHRGDLTDGYDCSGYDLALCLEVAEHLTESSARPLVQGLCGASTVLFSAATPGQPGVGHINCQPHEFWHDLFAEHGYHPRHLGSKFDEPVADFYRRNMFLYQ